MHIIFIGYEIVQQAGLVLKFNVDGIIYRRFSIIKAVGYFEKGMLLWWKRNGEEYLDEYESADMENMAETYFKNINKPLAWVMEDKLSSQEKETGHGLG